MDNTFSITAEKQISVLLPTRSRPELALSSLKTLVELADDPDSIEFLVALDDDDNESANYFQETCLPYFEEHGLTFIVYQVPRWGYRQLNEYINFLGMKSHGAWMVFWNDDAVMQTQGWDTVIRSHNGEFKLLAFQTHNMHPYSIFPIVPRDWILLFETLSPHQQTDAFCSQVAYLADCWERIPVEVLHDRADLTGNNDDEIYRERHYYEGDIDNPLDINHKTTMIKKHHFAAKIVWLRKLLGQDQGWHDKWTRGEVNAWQKMLDNDVNNQIVIQQTK